MKFFLGIDPGLNGGIAGVSEGGINLHKTPVIGKKEYDIQEMKNMLVEVKDHVTLAVIENQTSMPGQGLTSTFTTGKGYGIWLGLLAGLNIPYQVVQARAWQVKMFTGVSGALDTKQKSEVVAKRLFPEADFRKSDRARKADDGLTDAACIAEYARRQFDHTPEKVTGLACEAYENVPNICKNCGQPIDPNGENNNCQQLTI